MKKNDYKNPNMLVVEIQQRQFLAASGNPVVPGSGDNPEDNPGGGNVREYRGGTGDDGSNSSAGSVWNGEW